MSREPDSATESGVRRRILQVAAMLALLPLVLFAGAGTLSWLWAWVYLGLTLLGIAATAVVMRQHRETIAERSRAQGTEDWDKVVGGLWGLCYFIAVPLVAGLDAPSVGPQRLPSPGTPQALSSTPRASPSPLGRCGRTNDTPPW